MIMKSFKHIVLVLLPLVLVATSFKDDNSIKGKWVFSDSQREVEIYLDKGKYVGKITKVSGEIDAEKVGHILFADFVYSQVDKTYSGTIKPPDGLTASGEIIVLEKNKLKLIVKKFFSKKTFLLTRIE